MKIRPQTIIGGVLLLLAEILAGKMSYYTIDYSMYEIFNFKGQNLGWLFANLFFSLISILVILSAIFAFINKSKVSAFLALGAVISWFAAAFFWIFAQVNERGSYYFGTAVRNVTLGWREDEAWVKLAALPTLVVLVLALVLIFIGRKPALVNQFAPTLPGAPQQVGMKSCPECAEMIQSNAVKCRFCNYRY